ncbi:Fic family protein [Paraburkholderia bryophila]|uniref:Fic family protein n=1 Tax=Paraburkholderia bryophila TaxID=420952 RepID=A0A7Z0B801_9BURK|nr:Fic family protein [Paraburkholderia bryophila]NYH23718.1 Fic family protein [Paraburkholderia bryophila]
MFNLASTPYLLDASAEAQLSQRLSMLEERVAVLRNSGTLSTETIRSYYGEKRFEQVAESNALEGNTLSVGETELAVMKGITITGHDPAFAKDAIDLDKALARLAEMARDRDASTDLAQLHELHSLILGDRPGAGILRKERVAIRGAAHTPPKTWEEVMSGMEAWQEWSAENATLPAPIRSAVLHAWMTHIHPYIDGNGRTARALTNLELVRAGYPPIIIKKKERYRYLEALAESDLGGDIRSFIELVLDKLDGALTGLELSAKKMQGYNPILEKLRIKQESQLKIWENSITLLAAIVEHHLRNRLEQVGGTCQVKVFDTPLDVEDYVELCAGRNVARTWAFVIKVSVPGVPSIEKLAYIGHRSSRMFQHLGHEGGPSLFWSIKNPNGFPKWVSIEDGAPGGAELTTKIGNGDEWHVRQRDQIIMKSMTELGNMIADALVAEAVE